MTADTEGTAGATRQALRSMLAEEQARVLARVAKLEVDIDALTSARRSESDDDEHDPEGVTLSSQWSMLGGLLESAREDARQAESALHRLAEGTYGVCASCGNAIPAEQLEVRPFRERCVPCASKLERG
ncbi:TraR/DksA family transcriptional regulator [Leucobacter sp. M11]|uniref:TraR/DksA family transcriptional regulator n=1 Tax=Leucobacter sp. M11 TaxID=2993565 RepID=UPI002D7FE82F|nr:TraR/DksA C4-type zinc finger protein [Leucobacter sp. M11]MEB4614450.1 TraR/DksA C4-type zinc finger protein [Leucobacter sp. M11]